MPARAAAARASRSRSPRSRSWSKRSARRSPRRNAEPQGGSAARRRASRRRRRQQAPGQAAAKTQEQGARLMGQKCNPIGLRLGVNRTWDSRWYASKKEYGKLLQEDIKIRNYLQDKLKQAGVSRIFIERPHKKCRVTIHSARPGVVIGKKGADIEKLKSDLGKLHRFRNPPEHRRNPQARDRRQARRRQYRPAARAPRRLPPRHEARGAIGDAAGRAGHPHQLHRTFGRRRNRARGVVPRGPRAAAHAARRHRLRRLHREDDLRHLRRQGLGLQGRDHGTRSHGPG